MNQERRSNYFIKKKFQTIFILKFCALTLSGSLISTLIIYFITRGTVTTSFENLKLVIKSTADYILPAVLLSSGIVVTAISIATIFLTLYTSHKIAGPLYRIEKDLEKLENYNLSFSIKLRSNDEIQYLAEKINNSVRKLNKKISLLKNEINELQKENLPPSVQKKLNNIKNIIEKFKTS